VPDKHVLAIPTLNGLEGKEPQNDILKRSSERDKIKVLE
jgi:hypothetical protein